MDKTQLLEQLKLNKISEKTLSAFGDINRADFVSKKYKKYAYFDNPLPTSQGQTTSQPYTIAFMLDLLELEENSKQKVLEIGSGSGYVLALINSITKGKTYGVEIITELAEKSKEILKNNEKVIIINESGKNGLPKHSPYDRILISAACKKVPKHILTQINDKGIVVASVKNSVFKLKKENSRTYLEEFKGFVFVPLVD